MRWASTDPGDADSHSHERGQCRERRRARSFPSSSAGEPQATVISINLSAATVYVVTTGWLGAALADASGHDPG